MLLVTRHTLEQRAIGAGSDQVITHVQIPSECWMANLWAEVHAISSGSVSVLHAQMFGVDGLVLPDVDPGTIDTIDDVWDQMVTKDDDFAGELDIDGFDADTNPVFEPGEPNINNVIGLSVFDESNRFFKKRKMVTFASGPRGFEVGTPDSYIPADVFKIRSSKSIQAVMPSYGMVGFSAPQQDDVTATLPSTLGTEAAWMHIKYLDLVLEQAFTELVGLTETGAETPWIDAANLLEDLLEPDVVEPTAGSFSSSAWTVFCMATWQMAVPGMREIDNISAG